MQGIMLGLRGPFATHLITLAGGSLRPVSSKEELLAILKSEMIDFVILGDFEQIALIPDIRALPKGGDVVITALTFKEDREAQIWALNKGADFTPDFGITDNFDTARVMRYVWEGTLAALRRAELFVGSDSVPGILRYARSLVINLKRGKVYIEGKEVKLTLMEWGCLQILVHHPIGVVVPKERFYHSLYPLHGQGDKPNPTGNIIHVFICTLRQKLQHEGVPNFGKHCIKTVWGRGYIWNIPLITASPTRDKKAA